MQDGASYVRDRKAQLTLFIILGLVIVILLALAIYITQPTVQVVERAPLLKADCEDGTKNNTCSAAQPLKCRNGVLRPGCADCGCPINERCNADGSCGGSIAAEPTNFTLFIIPIGYQIDDKEFLYRLQLLKSSFFANTKLTDANVVVTDPLPAVLDCVNITKQFDRHVQVWLQKSTGKGLPGLRFEGGVPLYRYRLIGLDKRPQDPAICGCAHTLVYSPNIYATGNDCGKSSNVVLHEFGHTAGMCDEYDTCVYEETDVQMREAFGHPCLNRRPTLDVSDCGARCCSEGKACCDGVYADTKADGFFNIMGSANIPPQRRLDTRTKGILDAYLCGTMGVCG